MTGVALGLLAAAALLSVLRVVRPGSTVVDRVLGLDTLLLVVVSGVAVLAARTGSGRFLDAFVVTGLLGFVSTITAARFVERRGAR